MRYKCEVCGKQLAKHWAKRCRSHRILSQETRDKISHRMLGNNYGFKKGQPSWNKGKKGGTVWNKGIKYVAVTGERNWQWQGESATYRVKHRWVTRHLGTPDTCEHCGKSGLSGRQIHWANIDHTYRRVAEDWIRLCAKCHKAYDKTI